MPRFFFHFSGTDAPDTEGVELQDVHEARYQGVVTAGAVLRDDGESLADGGALTLTITDEAGAQVCEINLSVGN